MECEAMFADAHCQRTELPAGYAWGVFVMPVAYQPIAAMQQVGADSIYMQPMSNAIPRYDCDSFDGGHAGLEGQVWQYAMHPDGCRLVQQAFDDATSDAARSALAKELHTHVAEAWRSPNANHVLQKCIATLPPHEFQFIITEIQQAGPGALASVARHQYGCRILQRLLEFASPAQLGQLVEDLSKEAVPLCNDIYASFVLQHMLQHGTESHVSNLVRLFAANAFAIGSDPHGVTVLEKALSCHAPLQDRKVLAHALAAEPNLLLSMSLGRHGRHGHNVAKLALRMSAPEHREFALLSLQRRKQSMSNSRYGKKLLNCVEELLREVHRRAV
jgi:hypothetical protein